MNDTVIKVEGLYKKFCRSLKRSMFYGTMDVTRNMLGIPYKTDDLRKQEFWTLKDISFELNRGETLGIIGVNGSGKSTLLRLLSGIFPPDEGMIYLKGKISSLIAVGAGFHPHMTGRENIYLNGILLGMNKKEIEKKFDSIVEFSGIETFLDSPVSTYSSGMYIRLGFSIAIHCEPDILLVDEVLAVGDLSFRNKSMRKLYEIRKKAATIFISHDMASIRKICNRVIFLDKGEIKNTGTPDDIINEYQDLCRERGVKELNSELKNHDTSVNEYVKILKNGLLDKNDNVIDTINVYDDLIIFIDFISYIEESLIFGIGIINDLHINLVYDTNIYNNMTLDVKKDKKHRIKVVFKNCNISPGLYSFSMVILNRKTDEIYWSKRHNIEKHDLNVKPMSYDSFYVRGLKYPETQMFLQSEWGVHTID